MRQNPGPVRGTWYHVTYLSNVPRIQAEGLVPNIVGQYNFPRLKRSTKGNIFLTKWGGVRFWHTVLSSRSEGPEWLEEGKTPVVLAVDFEESNIYAEYSLDIIGTREVSLHAAEDRENVRAIKVKAPIPAEDLYIWDADEELWVPLEQFDVNRIQQIATNVAKSFREYAATEADPNDVIWTGASLFMPDGPMV